MEVRANRLMTRRTLRVAIVTLVWVTMSKESIALASDSSEEMAQRFFREGVDAARQQRWLDARTAFERAYRLSERPVVLINLAGAQARTGSLLEAANNYRKILAAPATSDTASFRAAAAETLPALDKRIPRVRARSTDLTSADVMELDGEQIPPGKMAEWLPLDPGSHTIAVRRAGIERARVTFSLAEGESHDVTLPLPHAIAPSALFLAGPRLEGESNAIHPVPMQGSGDPSPSRFWTTRRIWIGALSLVTCTALTVVFIARERADTLYSGNVPPGISSVK